jgi:PAS domain S-box-containing protein
VAAPSGTGKNKKEILKRMIKKLHKGADPEKMKEEFQELLGEITTTEISQAEEELINEGMPREEIHRLCDVHLAVFRETIEKEQTLAQAGHPVYILMEEHKLLLKFAEELRNVAKGFNAANSFQTAKPQVKILEYLVNNFRKSESHYLREENVLFPYLEKHGVTQPPAIMWMEHDKIREIEKSLYQLADTREKIVFQDFTKHLEQNAQALAEMLSNHFYKENNVLFPTALRVIGEGEWTDIRTQFDELGYCPFTPESATTAFEGVEASVAESEMEGLVPFETGTITKETLEAIFNTLPVDITFIDKGDTVRFYSESEDRIFVRTKAVIGRKVQQCHPQKSLKTVKKILDTFKKGIRDKAEFWINLQGKTVYIRYFPLRNEKGDYLGCLEVTQDITKIKEIKEERRLLNWS